MNAFRAIDPTWEQIAAAFPRGALAAESERRWHDLAGQPQGEILLPHEGIAWRLVWWTDFLRRRHVVVRPVAATRNKPIPPLYWIAPPGACAWRSRTGQTRQLVLACRCGAMGTPEQLAWMGDECGPCHDRQQDGLPSLGHPWLDAENRELRGMLCMPEGRVLIREVPRGVPDHPALARVHLYRDASFHERLWTVDAAFSPNFEWQLLGERLLIRETPFGPWTPRIFSLSDGQEMPASLPESTGGLWATAGAILLLGSVGGEVAVWHWPADAERPKRLHHRHHAALPHRARLSPRGHLALLEGNGRVEAYAPWRDEPLGEVPGSAGWRAHHWTPHGDLLVLTEARLLRWNEVEKHGGRILWQEADHSVPLVEGVGLLPSIGWLDRPVLTLARRVVWLHPTTLAPEGSLQGVAHGLTIVGTAGEWLFLTDSQGLAAWSWAVLRGEETGRVA